MHWHEIRGHLLATTGNRLEDAGVPDFIDVVYNYSINSPQMRGDFRTAMVTYIFDIEPDAEELDADMSFTGFQSKAMSLIDELDSFNESPRLD